MKRLWSLLLIALLIPCLVTAASAAETSGTCGEKLTWVFDDTTGTLTISGTGSMDDFYSMPYWPNDDTVRIHAPWDRDALKAVVIEEGVTSIGSGAFYEAYNLSCVTLPSSLTNIGEHAFYDCGDLTEIVFPDSLATIDYCAFQYCRLTKVTLPNNNHVQIDEDAFCWASISTVEIPANMTVLPVNALAECTVSAYAVAGDNQVYCAAGGILFSKDQTELVACPGKHIFANGQYTVPDSVTAIGDYAFLNCYDLRSVTVPASVSEVGTDAFKGCYNLTGVYISDLEQWLQISFENEFANPLNRGSALYLNGRAITDLVIPEGTEAIGNYAFYGMQCSGDLTIPGTVSSIGTSAFNFYSSYAPEAVHISDLSAWMNIRFDSNTANPLVRGGDLYVNGSLLTEVVLPAGSTSVGDYVFSDCDTLTSITIPASVTSIGKGAFWDCDALTSVSVPDSVTSIGEGAFERCSKLTAIHIPKNLKILKNAVFSQCSALTSVTLPQTVTSIGDSAFYQCSALASVNIPEAVTAIGDSAFRQCRKLTSITVPDSVTSIGSSAFAYCSGLTELNLGTGLKELGEYAFIECKRIRELTISGAVGTIPGGVAEDCVSLERVTLGEGITYIDSSAFEGCTKLKSVTIPSTVKQIYRDAFKNCTAMTDFYLQDIRTWIDMEFLYVNLAAEGPDVPETYYSYDYLLGWNEEPKNLYVKGKKLTDLVIPAGTKALDEYAFCRTTIRSAVIPGSVAIIPEYAFSGCVSLERVVIGSKMADINEEAFSRCKKLETVTLPSSIYYVGENAFYGCTELSKVYYGGSKTKREKINIEDGNPRLKNASWEYNCNLDLDAPVIGITGNTTTGKPKVTWTKVEGAERYRVYRAASKSGSYKYLGYTSSLSYTDKTAKAGTNYYYKVTAFDTDTQTASLYSNIVNRVCDLKKPVVTLKVDTASGKPKITWEKISGAQKYYIARAESENGKYTKLVTTTSDKYIDRSAKAGIQYYYKVKALHEKDSADSVYSDIVSRVCDLKKPVVTITLSKGDPRIKWEAVSGAEEYRIYRATSKSGEFTLVKTTKTATSYTDTDVKAGKTYYYKVRAVHANSEANSAYSAVRSIKTK